MKATGIVRRIDELGRVVIPKEIRTTLRIKSGDPLEIYTDHDELRLKKYSPIATLEQFSTGTAKCLSSTSGLTALITDTDEVLYASGTYSKGLIAKKLTSRLEEIMLERKSYLASLTEGGDIIEICEGVFPVTAQIVVPIINGGDCLGTVCLLSDGERATISGENMRLATLAADILSCQFD